MAVTGIPLAMKPVDPQAFDRKQAEAAPPAAAHDANVIRAQMNRNDWLILGVLALIWGGAFFFIGVAVRHVPPLTYVWLRLTIAAAAMWLFLTYKGEKLGLALDPAARFAQQCASLHPVRLGPDAYRERARLHPQRHDADLGRGRCPF